MVLTSILFELQNSLQQLFDPSNVNYVFLITIKNRLYINIADLVMALEIIKFSLKSTEITRTDQFNILSRWRLCLVDAKPPAPLQRFLIIEAFIKSYAKVLRNNVTNYCILTLYRGLNCSTTASETGKRNNDRNGGKRHHLHASVQSITGQTIKILLFHTISSVLLYSYKSSK